MHMLIYALVEASTRDEALAAGRSAFDRLVGVAPDANAVFDYYVTFDEADVTGAGKARWGERPAAAPIESDAGEDLLEAGWEATIEAFEQNLTAVREGLDELNDEAIMRDEDLVRHACHNLGTYRGPSVVLYDEHGQGVRDRDRLKRILDGVESCWIVPVDVHY
ncbi:hypothetical protein EFA46_015065 (plasmid) [Halarchaeum sp. CBA1220]|uniref:hypothetical protein n=1 Tax=Halarchaeum sp. CBA1220 TaxID=1853682 RepID=UPI000F3AA1F1|nr:hypothetical protein [Halarchaeum sp. CBA1220]QLC35550.1 hypothetical protein EFA46_015065 [Halarchaeum sp. CBA1220]